MADVDLVRCRISAKVFIDAAELGSVEEAKQIVLRELTDILIAVIHNKNNIIRVGHPVEHLNMAEYSTDLYVFTPEEFNSLICHIKNSYGRSFIVRG